MKLIHDPEHDIWQFIQGESIIPLDGERTFIEREQAIATARKVGLAIDKAGNVVIAGRKSAMRSTKSKQQHDNASHGRLAEQNRRITLWLDPASIARLDQLAQSHGSRGEAVRWLLTNMTPH